MSKRKKVPAIRIPSIDEQAALDRLEDAAMQPRDSRGEGRAAMAAVATSADDKKSAPKSTVGKRGKAKGRERGRAKGTGTLRARERGERLTLLVAEEVAQRLRVFSATERRSMSDVVTAALSQYLPVAPKS